jgi:hypothetical protein
MPDFDLVDQMHWEDLVDFISLEEAGLENADRDGVTAAQLAYYQEEGDH